MLHLHSSVEDMKLGNTSTDQNSATLHLIDLSIGYIRFILWKPTAHWSPSQFTLGKWKVNPGHEVNPSEIIILVLSTYI